MRIRFITHENIHMPGARVRCYNLAKRLARRGWDAEVLSLHDLFGKPYSKLTDAEMMMNSFRLMGLLEREPPDTILYMQRINYHSLAPFLMTWARKNPLILDCDDWDFDAPIFRSLRYLPGFSADLWLKEVLEKATGCVASSRALETFLRQHHSRVAYVPTGADTEAFRPGPDRPDPAKLRVSWLGTVFRNDNLRSLQLAIRSFARVFRQAGKCGLEILCTGALIGEIHRLVEKECADVDIQFLQWRGPEEIPGYLAGVDVGLLPLVPANRFNECKSPTKLFEYMATAIPTVVSAVGEARTVIRQGIDGFLAETEDEFAAYLLKLVQNSELRYKMGQSARQRVIDHYAHPILEESLVQALQSWLPAGNA